MKFNKEKFVSIISGILAMFAFGIGVSIILPIIAAICVAGFFSMLGLFCLQHINVNKEEDKKDNFFKGKWHNVRR